MAKRNASESTLIQTALKGLLVDKRGTDPQVSLVEGVECLSVLWATTRYDGIPGFDQKEGWQFGESDEDKGLVAVHLYADGRFHVTSPDTELMYLTGKVRTNKELATVLKILDSIKQSDVDDVAVKDQPLADWLE